MYCWSRVFIDTPEIYMHVQDDGAVIFIETQYFAPCVSRSLNSSANTSPKPAIIKRKSKALNALQKSLQRESQTLNAEMDNAEDDLIPLIPNHQEVYEEEEDAVIDAESSSDGEEESEEDEDTKSKKKRKKNKK